MGSHWQQELGVTGHMRERLVGVTGHTGIARGDWGAIGSYWELLGAWLGEAGATGNMLGRLLGVTRCTGIMRW